MQNRQTYQLRGSKTICTDVKYSAYRVENGTALIYLTAEQNGKAGYKLLILETGKHTFIPSVCYTDEEGITLKLVIEALETAEVVALAVDSDAQAHREAFAHAAGLQEWQRLGLEEALAERYRLYQVKNDAFIYQTEKDHRLHYEQSLRSILRVFYRNREAVSSDKSRDGLYNAVSWMAKRMRIPVASHADVKAAGAGVRVEDISRLSNFIARKVTLEDLWYRKDMGYVLAFVAEDGHPVVMQPVGTHRYDMVNVDTGARTPVNAEIADGLEDSGYVFYRPLPNRVLKWKDIFRFVLESLHPGDFVIYGVMALLAMGIGLLLPEVNRLLYDRYIPSSDQLGLLQMGLMLLSFNIANVLFNIVQSLASFRITSRPEYAVDGAIYHRLMNLPLSALSKMESGDLASRVMGMGNLVCTMFEQAVSTGISVLLSLSYLARMIAYSDQMALAALAMLATQLAVTAVISQQKMKDAAQRTKLRGDINATLYQYLNGISKIRLSGSETNALVRYIDKLIAYKNLENKVSILISGAVGLVLSAVFTAVLYLMVGTSGGTISAGSYIAFTSAYGAFSGAILGAANFLMNFQQVKPVFERARFLLENCPESVEGQLLPGDLTGEIEVSNVSFAYDIDEGNVLENISVKIKAGEYVALVGASGCGKSTLLKLLLGFEKPNRGAVYYDGTNIASLDKRELRKKFGVVLQNGSLISGSIQENITITAPGCSIERVMEVLREVGLEKDIEDMPMGIHTMLSEDGETISGGQKQRVLIARALADKPRIIFFDEATSALDNITQQMVCQTLESMQGTRLVIAHRLSTVKNCDRIIVLNRGRVEEEGTFDQLMEKHGLFYRMAERQIA